MSIGSRASVPVEGWTEWPAGASGLSPMGQRTLGHAPWPHLQAGALLGPLTCAGTPCRHALFSAVMFSSPLRLWSD